MFSDLISEYQQYQEATVDDYDSDEADKTQDEDWEEIWERNGMEKITLIAKVLFWCKI